MPAHKRARPRAHTHTHMNNNFISVAIIWLKPSWPCIVVLPAVWMAQSSAWPIKMAFARSQPVQDFTSEPATEPATPSSEADAPASVVKVEPVATAWLSAMAGGGKVIVLDESSDESGEEEITKVASMAQLHHDAGGHRQLDSMPTDPNLGLPGDDDAVRHATEVLLSGGGGTDLLQKRLFKLAAEKECQVPGSFNQPEPAHPDELMWEKLEAGDFFFSAVNAKDNRMGGRWSRFLKARDDIATQYKELATQKKKADFRKQWAKDRHAEFVEKKEFKSKQTIKFLTKGVYYSVARIQVEEGGGMSGKRAAINYALRCMSLGGEWCTFCDFTSQVKLLYCVKGKDEYFQQCWSLQRSWSSPDRSIRDTANPKASAKSKSQAKGQAKAKPKAKPSPSKPGAGLKRKGSSDLGASLQEVKKLKLEFFTVSHQTQQLKAKISSDPKWKWADDEETLGKLTRVCQELDEASLALPMWQLCLDVGDLVELKKMYDDHDILHAGLKGAAEAMSAKTSALSEVLSWIQEQQKIRVGS